MARVKVTIASFTGTKEISDGKRLLAILSFYCCADIHPYGVCRVRLDLQPLVGRTRLNVVCRDVKSSSMSIAGIC